MGLPNFTDTFITPRTIFPNEYSRDRGHVRLSAGASVGKFFGRNSSRLRLAYSGYWENGVGCSDEENGQAHPGNEEMNT